MVRELPAPVTIRWRLPLFPVIVVAAFATLVSRMPHVLFRAEFWADDAVFYTDALHRGVAAIIEPLSGYLNLGSRSVAVVATFVPPLYAPLVAAVLSLLVLAAAAAFATSDRLPWNRRTGLIVAFGIVALPASFEVVGNMAHLQWPLSMWLAMTALSTAPTTPIRRGLEASGIAVVGLSSLIGLLLLPLFVRGPRYRLLTLAAVALLQILVFDFGGRRDAGDVEWAIVPWVFFLRVLVAPLLGPSIVETLTQPALVAVGLVVLVGVLNILVRTPPPITTWAVYLGTSIPLLAIIIGGEATDSLARAATAPRYFWLTGVVLVVLIAVNRRHLLAIPLLLLLIGGIVIEWRILEWPGGGWAERSACIGGPVSCSIPVEPIHDGWRVEWRPGTND